jgi:uncharacterized membrane protein
MAVLEMHARGGRTEVRLATRRALVTGLIIGVSLVAALDQIVLHELLQWHNFYVHTTQYWRLFIDGLFHAFGVALSMWGALRLWQDRRLLARAGNRGVLTAGILLGMGGFSLYDGTIQHKVLRLHQVREGVANLWLYDLAFVCVALALLTAGYLVWKRSAPAAGPAAEEHDAPGRAA